MKKLARVPLILLVLMVLYAAALWWFSDPNVASGLDRKSLQGDSLRFGKGFLWGASTSAYQVEGNCTNSNWSEFEKSLDPKGSPRIARGERSGIAVDSDLRRARFIEDHLLVANRAIRDGMNVKGYFYWSLLDNFEWADGFAVRFGLYAVDYETQTRTLRNGSLKLKEIIKRSASLPR